MKYVAVQWIEDPPTWGIIPTTSIMSGNASPAVGQTVDCKYGDETAPAKLLKFSSKKSVLDSYLDTSEDLKVDGDFQENDPTLENDPPADRLRTKKIPDVRKNDENKHKTGGVVTALKNAEVAVKHRQKNEYRTILKAYDVNCQKQEDTDHQHCDEQIRELKDEVCELQKENQNLQQRLTEAQEIQKSLKKMPKTVRRLQIILDSLLENEPTIRNLEITSSELSEKKKEAANPHVPSSKELSETAKFQATTLPTADAMITIGKWGTCVRSAQYSRINFRKNPAQAARDLALIVFTRDVLATHSLTGKAASHYKDPESDVKKQLDSGKVDDIIEHIVKKTGAQEQDLRRAISAKCTDESKAKRKRDAALLETSKSC